MSAAVERNEARLVDHLGPEDDVVFRLQEVVRVAVDNRRAPRAAEEPDAALTGAPVGVVIALPARPEVCGVLPATALSLPSSGPAPRAAAAAAPDTRAPRNSSIRRVDHPPRPRVHGRKIVEPVDGHRDRDPLIRFTAAGERRLLHGLLLASGD